MSIAGSGGKAFSSNTMTVTPAPRFPSALTGVVHQDAAHQRRRHGEEVRAIAPLEGIDPRQPQVHLVDERRRRQRMAGALAAHVVMRKAAQLLVDDRHEPLACVGVAVRPIGQEIGDALLRGVVGLWNHRCGPYGRILTHTAVGRPDRTFGPAPSRSTI